MAIFDIACIVIVGLSIMFGVLKGFVHQVLKILGMVAAIFLIVNFRPDIENWLSAKIGIDAAVAAFLVLPAVFFGVFVVISILTYFARASLKKARFGSVDRILGLLLGAAKGAVICAAIFYALVQYPGESINKSLREHRVFPDSWAAKRLVEVAENKNVRPHLPADFIFKARMLLKEAPPESLAFLPERFWARYSARDTDAKKKAFLAENSGRKIQTEVCIDDVEADGDSVTLTANVVGLQVEMKIV